MVKRIALVGSSSTGKTTVYELLKNKLPKYEFVTKVLVQLRNMILL